MSDEQEQLLSRFTILHSEYLAKSSTVVYVYDQMHPDLKIKESNSLYGVSIDDPSTLKLVVDLASKLAQNPGSNIVVECIDVNWSHENQEYY